MTIKWQSQCHDCQTNRRRQNFGHWKNNPSKNWGRWGNDWKQYRRGEGKRKGGKKAPRLLPVQKAKEKHPGSYSRAKKKTKRQKKGRIRPNQEENREVTHTSWAAGRTHASPSCCPFINNPAGRRNILLEGMTYEKPLWLRHNKLLLPRAGFY